MFIFVCEKLRLCKIGGALGHHFLEGSESKLAATGASLNCLLVVRYSQESCLNGKDFVWFAEEINFQGRKAIAATCATRSKL